MNSHGRRKARRATERAARRLAELVKTVNVTQHWDQVLQGLSPAGKTNNWGVSNVTTKQD